MKPAQHARGKYSNLMFVLFNALFLLGIFWMLPALGGDHDAPARPNVHAAATGRPAAAEAAAPSNLSFHAATRVLFQKGN